MYRLADDFDLSELVGQQLNQLCIGPFDIQLHFDDGWTIRGQGKVSGVIESRREVWFHGEWNTTLYLPHVVGKDVIDWKKNGDFEFELEFLGGAKLAFETTESQYEDFIIELPNGALLVL